MEKTHLEGRMTASVHKQDPNKQKAQKNANAIDYDKTQHANFRVVPLFQATKLHLNSNS